MIKRVPHMENGKRTGPDRRSSRLHVPEDRRRGVERRVVLRDPDLTAGRLRTIPMFKGLSTGRLCVLLAICVKKSYAKGDTIFQSGEESAEMFVLVRGKIDAIFPEGGRIENFSPEGIVGGLGVITGENRTSTVTAATDLIVLAFRKEELTSLFARDTGLHSHILTNVIADLVGRLRSENDLIEDLRRVRSFEIL